MGKEFLMPAVKNSRVKNMIRKYHNDEIDAASLFKITSQKDGEAQFNLLIVEKDNWKESDDVTDRYVAFTTNTPCRTKEELVKILPETYRKRWIIETAFRTIKNTMGKTCSNALQVRIFLFYFAMLLYSLWILTKYSDVCSGGFAGQDNFTFRLFVEFVHDVVKVLLMWEVQHGNYLNA